MTDAPGLLRQIRAHARARPPGKNPPLSWWVPFGELVSLFRDASESAATAIECVARETGFSSKEVQRAAQLADPEKFPAGYLKGLSARAKLFKWGYVREVLSGNLTPEDRTRLLNQAADHGWGLDTLRAAVAEARQAREPDRSVPGPKPGQRRKAGDPPALPTDAMNGLEAVVRGWLNGLATWPAATAEADPAVAAAGRTAARTLSDLATAAQAFAADLRHRFPEPGPGPEPGPARRRKASR